MVVPEGTIAADAHGHQRRRILLCTSPGGVFADLAALRPWWSRHETAWIAVRAADTESVLADQDVHWVPEVPPGRPLELARAVTAAHRHLGEWRPDLVVSAGTGVAVPVFVAARTRRIPTWWVETFNLLGPPGRSARLCSALSDRVLVQRPELLATRRRSLLVGELY